MTYQVTPDYTLDFYMKDGKCNLDITGNNFGNCDVKKKSGFNIWVYHDTNHPERGGRVISCNFQCDGKSTEINGMC